MTRQIIVLILFTLPVFLLGNILVHGEEENKADLLLEQIYLDNEFLAKGSETKIWVIVKNGGTEPSNDSQVAFYVNGELFDEESIKSKPIGRSVTANSNTWVYPGGIFTIKACVDPNDTYLEKNEDNNCQSIHLPSAPETSTTPGSSIMVTSLSLEVSPKIIQEKVETPVTVSGKLIDTNSAMGLPGKFIHVGPSFNKVQVVTDSEGIFSHTFPVIVKSGTLSVSASFNGDKTARSSNTISSLVIVNYPPPVEEIPIEENPIEETPSELPTISEEPESPEIQEEPEIIPVEHTPPEISETEFEIPTWIKNTAGLWSENSVGVDEFGAGISFMIDQELISVPNSQNENSQDKVPEWVRVMAGWWADEFTTDREFADAIKFLIIRGIVSV